MVSVAIQKVEGDSIHPMSRTIGTTVRGESLLAIF